MSGTTCAKTFSAPGSGTPTTTSSRPAQPHGAFSSATLNASDQSAIATGRVSVFKRVGITPRLNLAHARPEGRSAPRFQTASLPTLRDASLRDAPQGEVFF